MELQEAFKKKEDDLLELEEFTRFETDLKNESLLAKKARLVSTCLCISLSLYDLIATKKARLMSTCLCISLSPSDQRFNGLLITRWPVVLC